MGPAQTVWGVSLNFSRGCKHTTCCYCFIMGANYIHMLLSTNISYSPVREVMDGVCLAAYYHNVLSSLQCYHTSHYS